MLQCLSHRSQLITDNPLQFVLLPHDILRKLKLTAGAYQIVRRIVALEVNIPVKVILQEACCQFDGDRECCLYQGSNLLCGQRIFDFLNESLRKGTELRGIKAHLRQVGFVFHSGIGDETNRIAEIIHRHTGHDGVEVDDRDRTLGDTVKEDVVRLGIVVCHTSRQFSVCLTDAQLGGIVTDRSNVVEFGLYFILAVLYIGFGRGKQIIETLLCVVEVRSGFVRVDPSKPDSCIWK